MSTYIFIKILVIINLKKLINKNHNLIFVGTMKIGNLITSFWICCFQQFCETAGYPTRVYGFHLFVGGPFTIIKFDMLEIDNFDRSSVYVLSVQIIYNSSDNHRVLFIITIR